MPQRPKRKRDSTQDSPAVVMSSLQIPGSGQNEKTFRPTPTPETQDLYNKYRMLEDTPSLDDIQRLQEGLGNNDRHGDHLQPPTPSQATPMSRSPSCASTTYSVSHAMNNVDIGDDGVRGPKKRRAVRHGPLDERAKARAALLRKLGACESCRERKVKCDHYDFCLFEEAYQSSKLLFASQPMRSRRQSQQYGPPRQPYAPSPSSQQFPQSPYRPQFSDPLDLMGIGGIGVGQNLSPLAPRDPQGTQDDFDSLLQQINNNTQPSPVLGNNAAPLDYFRQPARNPMNTPVTHLSPASISRNLPIGKQISRPEDQVWECLWGDGGAECSVSGGEAEACNKRFRGLASLTGHFTHEHAPFQDSHFMWRCTACKFNCTFSPPMCSNCPTGRPNWQWWYWGTISATPSLTSGSSVRIGNQDTTAAIKPSYAWPAHNSTQFFGSNDTQYTSFNFTLGGGGGGGGGGSGYGNGGGGSQTYNLKVAPEPPDRPSPLDDDCPYSKASFSKLLKLWAPSHFSPYLHFIHGMMSFLTSYALLPCLVLSASLFLQLLEILMVVGDASLTALAHIISRAVDGQMPELPVACAVAGGLGIWLHKHVKLRPGVSSGYRCVYPLTTLSLALS
ncbi:hypothetical protein B0H63DRAFT_526910 [Podospora didyma]|uniref:Zn(2)-C6 fungal-type domain-containing protein n=1 Tax=Podospora didyma TaxID=330526 RepID=A0AAE0K9R6_9PEZI|nr:hypothetical protein B0H63DRAFT_526910 [Podospora didyma]